MSGMASTDLLEINPRVLNINVGILGHVDSGKTSLARALSTLISTAALDKHPQSAERGITLDLGFSAFMVDMPEHLKHLPFDKLQITLVDCPGHASLLKTIIGGAQIIDLMLLVIDATKGFQTQTAECLIVGEISPSKDMVVVLNKIDLLPSESRNQHIERMKKRLRNTLKETKFSGCPIVCTSARPGGSEGSANGSPLAEGMNELIEELKSRITELERCADKPFLFSIDHCFPIKGQGSVMTGTVLQGKVSVNQIVEIPALKVQRKVKSLQMFRRPVLSAMQGDRVGICVTQLDSKSLERGLAAEPGSVPTFTGAIVSAQRIRFFKGRIGGKTKFHVTVGHTTVMAEALFFGSHGPFPSAPAQDQSNGPAAPFDFTADYEYQDELLAEGHQEPPEPSNPDKSFRGTNFAVRQQWALLTFDSPVTCPEFALVIGSRLDSNIHSNSCRLAFHGRIVATLDLTDKDSLKKLMIYKSKSRTGIVDRVVDSHTIICRGLLKKDSNVAPFVGLRVSTIDGETGVIQSPFGKSGKVKVVFQSELKDGGSHLTKAGKNALLLHFKRYLFDKSKRMSQ